MNGGTPHRSANSVNVFPVIVVCFTSTLALSGRLGLEKWQSALVEAVVITIDGGKELNSIYSIQNSRECETGADHDEQAGPSPLSCCGDPLPPSPQQPVIAVGPAVIQFISTNPPVVVSIKW